MATAPNRPCLYAGCRSYASEHSYCVQHQGKRRVADVARGTAAQRGYDSKWQRARLEFLRVNPLCGYCLSAGHVVAANVVDHITPHKGDNRLMWSRSNWQALCKPCHDRKTATVDRGAWAPSLNR